MPFKLGVLNAPGCTLYTSLEFQFLMRTNAAGAASFRIAVPNNSVFKGVRFYNQYVIDDPRANGYGASFSNAGAGVGG